MLSLKVLASLAAALVAGSEVPNFCEKGSKNATEACDLFQEFEEKYEKTYDTEAKRLEHYIYFVENLVHAKIRAKRDPTASFGHLSPLADMSRAAFRTRNALSQQWPSIMKGVKRMPQNLLDSEDVGTDAFDWRKKGAVNPVKDQKQCGSCWAFATVANVEGVHFNLHDELLSLSEQELVSCDPTDNGCNGGLPANAYQWLITKHRGLEQESDYKYDALDEACELDKSKQRVFVNDFLSITPGREDQMAKALIKYGPLSIGLNADPLQMYQGGISDPDAEDCDPEALDHGVTIVGFGHDDGLDWWCIRNSWGPLWGEKGYFRLSRGKGTCGVDQMATTATITKDKPFGEEEVLEVQEEEVLEQILA